MQNKVNKLNNAIINAVGDFLEHFLDYPTDIDLWVNPETLEVKVESPSKMTADFQQYPIVSCILINEKGLYEPNGEAIAALAEKILA
ncbi:MAG: hypothetical protein J5701_04405 [Bacteroidales bacterium]|nr:hypothetical protein [Bacteroidales bacterium]